MDENNNDEEYKGIFYNKDKKLKENVFNFNNKGKSRNVIIEKDNSNLGKVFIIKEEEKNSEKSIPINKNNINNNINNDNMKKKPLAISSFQIIDKKIQGVLNINISTNKKTKISPDKPKIINERPSSTNSKNTKKKIIMFIIEMNLIQRINKEMEV